MWNIPNCVIYCPKHWIRPSGEPGLLMQSFWFCFSQGAIIVSNHQSKICLSILTLLLGFFVLFLTMVYKTFASVQVRYWAEMWKQDQWFVRLFFFNPGKMKQMCWPNKKQIPLLVYIFLCTLGPRQWCLLVSLLIPLITVDNCKICSGLVCGDCSVLSEI